jgi:hypothetical protein
MVSEKSITILLPNIKKSPRNRALCRLAEMKNRLFYHSLSLKNRIKWAFSHNAFH